MPTQVEIAAVDLAAYDELLAAEVGDHLPQRSPMVGVETASTLPSKSIHRFGKPTAATISTALLAPFRCLLST